MAHVALVTPTYVVCSLAISIYKYCKIRYFPVNVYLSGFYMLTQLESEESESELDSETVCDTEIFKTVDIAQQVETNTNELKKLLVSRYWAGESDKELSSHTDLAHNW